MFILNLGHARPYTSLNWTWVLRSHLLEGKLLVRASVVRIDENGCQVRLVAARHIEDLVRIRHTTDPISTVRYTATDRNCVYATDEECTKQGNLRPVVVFGAGLYNLPTGNTIALRGEPRASSRGIISI